MDDKWQQAVDAAKQQAETNDGPTAAVESISGRLADTCPEDGCGRSTKKRHHAKPSGMPKPAADRHEAVCSLHGIVDSER